MPGSYKNGRKAKVGDMVILIQAGAAGIVRSIAEDGDITVTRVPVDGPVGSAQCLHADDIGGAKDTTKPESPPPR